MQGAGLGLPPSPGAGEERKKPRRAAGRQEVGGAQPAREPMMETRGMKRGMTMEATTTARKMVTSDAQFPQYGRRFGHVESSWAA